MVPIEFRKLNLLFNYKIIQKISKSNKNIELIYIQKFNK